METPIPSPAKKLPLKQKVEAILFSVGGRISLGDIARLARSREDAVREALQHLKEEYGQKDSSLILIEDGDHWKLAVRDHYLSVVKKIVTETELSKTVLETLAIIAFKYPIRQSDLIKLRTNKAYDHLRELEQQGFISRKKHGRTNLIKLTEKFFQYFDLPEENLKEHLADFESIAAAITRKEQELAERKQQQAQELEQIASQEDRIKQEIEGLDAPQEPMVEPGSGDAEASLKLGRLEVYDEDKEQPQTGTPLEVYDEGQEQPLSPPPSPEGGNGGDEGQDTGQQDGETTAIQQEPPEGPENQEEGAESTETAGQGEQQDGQLPSAPDTAQPRSGQPGAPQPGITTTPEMDAEIDRKVAEMLTPHHEEQDKERKEDEDTDGDGTDRRKRPSRVRKKDDGA